MTYVRYLRLSVITSITKLQLLIVCVVGVMATSAKADSDGDWLSGFALHPEINRQVTFLTCGDAEALFANFEHDDLDEKNLPLYYLVREYNSGHSFTFAGMSAWRRWWRGLQTLGQRCFENPDTRFISPPFQEQPDGDEDTGWQSDFIYRDQSKIRWELEDELYLADFRCVGIIAAVQSRGAGDAAARRTILRVRFYLEGAASVLGRPLAEVTGEAIEWCKRHPSHRLSYVEY